MLLAILLYQQKHSSLINYVNLLLLDEIPVISSSREELRYEERYFKNFMSFKTKRKLITKFLFYFLRKENVKSFIILCTNSTSAYSDILDIQTKLNEETTSVCRSEIYGVNGRTNKTEFILQKIREHTFTTLIVIVSTNKTFLNLLQAVYDNLKFERLFFCIVNLAKIINRWEK